MKNYFLFTLLAIAVSTSAMAQNKIATAVIKTTINCDHCKQCESCNARVEDALYKRKGIKRVTIDEKKMEIKVSYHTQKITLQSIRQSIADIGYDADDLKASAEAISKLDDCCKASK